MLTTQPHSDWPSVCNDNYILNQILPVAFAWGLYEVDTTLKTFIP